MRYIEGFPYTRMRYDKILPYTWTRYIEGFYYTRTRYNKIP